MFHDVPRFQDSITLLLLKSPTSIRGSQGRKALLGLARFLGGDHQQQRRAAKVRPHLARKIRLHDAISAFGLALTIPGGLSPVPFRRTSFNPIARGASSNARIHLALPECHDWPNMGVAFEVGGACVSHIQSFLKGKRLLVCFASHLLFHLGALAHSTLFCFQ